jgi:hypothetical protein
VQEKLTVSEPLFMVPFFENPDFVGRKDTMDQLENLLSPKGDNQRRAALRGLGGIGWDPLTKRLFGVRDFDLV